MIIIMFNDGVLRDVGHQTGGNLFDNRNTLYTGFPDNWELNRKVKRLSATPCMVALVRSSVLW